MNPYLFPGLEFGPTTIRRLIHAIPPEQWDAESYPGRFSPREVVAHLADWEPILQERMRISRDKPGATLQAYDEGVRAEEMGYRSLDPLEEAEVYLERRKDTIAWLKALEKEDWQKHGTHTERGSMTIYDQANLLLGHDLYHIDQLTKVLMENS